MAIIVYVVQYIRGVEVEGFNAQYTYKIGEGACMGLSIDEMPVETEEYI